MIMGIDISTYQNGIDLEKAKEEGVNFAIIRGGFTGFKDKTFSKDDKFEENYQKAKKAKIGVGVYYFSRATSYLEGQKEAEFLYENCLKNKFFEYPIYIDVEGSYTIEEKKNLNEAIRGFCEYIESKNGYVGIYSNLYFVNNMIDYNTLSKKYDFWLAYWGSEMPKKSKYGNYGMWQFGGSTNLIRSTKIAGIVCDQDYAYKNYPEIMGNKNLNNFTTKKPNTKKNIFNSIWNSIKKFINNIVSFFKR